MKKLFVLLFLYSVVIKINGQVALPVYPDSIFSTYYHQRWSLFKSLPQTKDDIIFIGNSITDGGEWSELFHDLHLKNRGISGDISAGVLKRMDEVVKRKPAKVFLMIGVNDLARGILPDSVVKNIILIAGYLKEQSPATKLFVQSILPVNDVYKMFGGHTSKGNQINQVNELLGRSAAKYRFTFIDLYSSFCNEAGKLKPEFSNDGLHLKAEGYLLWKHLVFPYVYDLEAKPSLLPIPQQLKWDTGHFKLYNSTTIVIGNDSLYNEASRLQKYLTEKGWQYAITNKEKNKEQFIELRIEKINSPSLPAEAYKLEVSKEKILITANTTHGIFNGIQTLRQLMRDGLIDACKITDWPAFSWRGYMIDVGRNYMSVASLKQQIEVMSQYKLNVFHFHATEDIAWRIAIKRYPQLTAPANMLRNKGLFYSENEMKELINYCNERHIILVPEIDMPGHSAAFRRAMKTDMQSDSGLRYVKDILKEFSEFFDLQYIHIGADEVKITNKEFIPAITKYLQGLGKKVIGWQPGGNFTDNTIRQLWMDDNAHLSANTNIQYIDSRHLYLNHMDPLESIVTIFNRKIGDKEKGDASLLGGTICMWHDRAVANENDILRMNPVYPAMLAFAERSWRGGGQTGWIANISDGDEKAFIGFENRLLDNRQLYFKEKPFAYAKQMGIKWSLYGPYDNGGDPLKKFEPETSSGNLDTMKTYEQVTGGTIVLRHWWAPLIKGAVKEPKENTTWYATTKIWSDEACEKNFWIGFNNISRSPATDSPPSNAWDNKGSAVWVNGRLIEPPQWKHGGQKGNSEIPLSDEGYEYREPTKIFLQKGWNIVLIKAPIGSFKGKDWQNPVKWMFTFVSVPNS
ncbi:MAG TPA: family 20 glycosylhydrolase [Chitinophagaceae bacterium]